MLASKEPGSYHLLLLLNTSLSRGLVPSGSPNPPLGSPEHREPTIEEFFTKWIVDSDDRHKENKIMLKNIERQLGYLQKALTERAPRRTWWRLELILKRF